MAHFLSVPLCKKTINREIDGEKKLLFSNYNDVEPILGEILCEKIQFISNDMNIENLFRDGA